MSQFARLNGIPVFNAPRQGKPSEIWKDWLLPTKVPYDVAVVVSFGYFLPSYVLSEFEMGTINIHPSLLPKYRGSSPIQYTILNGDEETGVSTIELSPKKFDSGKILYQSKLTVPPDVHYPQLHDMLGNQGGDDLVRVLSDLKHYQETATTQDSSLATLAPKIAVAESHIKWNSHTCHEIYSKFRAFHPRVNLYTYFGNKRVLLLDIRNPKQYSPSRPSDVAPGTPVYSKEQGLIFIKCVDGWIPCVQFRVAGKNTTIARDFYNGYLVNNSTLFSDEE